MKLIKCQYCGGKHQDTDDNKKWTCDYCDKENKPKTNFLQTGKVNKGKTTCSGDKNKVPLHLTETKTNNLKEILFNFIKAYKDPNSDKRDEAIETTISEILNREKALKNIPMGVSQFLAHGKKYGYDKYFQKALLTEHRKEIKRIKCLIAEENGKFCEFQKKALLKELADEVKEIKKVIDEDGLPTDIHFDYGYNEAVKETLKIIKGKN